MKKKPLLSYAAKHLRMVAIKPEWVSYTLASLSWLHAASLPGSWFHAYVSLDIQICASLDRLSVCKPHRLNLSMKDTIINYWVSKKSWCYCWAWTCKALRNQLFVAISAQGRYEYCGVWLSAIIGTMSWNVKLWHLEVPWMLWDSLNNKALYLQKKKMLLSTYWYLQASQASGRQFCKPIWLYSKPYRLIHKCILFQANLAIVKFLMAIAQACMTMVLERFASNVTL